MNDIYVKECHSLHWRLSLFEFNSVYSTLQNQKSKSFHNVSSRTGFEENIYLVSNRGKVTIDIRENL